MAQSIAQQVSLLYHQIQTQIEQRGLGAQADGVDSMGSASTFQVRSRPSLWLNSRCEIRPAIAVLEQVTPADQGTIRWILDIEDDRQQPETGYTRAEAADLRSQLYAQAQIPEYWLLTLSQVELRLYRQPTRHGYQQRKLLQVGERASPAVFPFLALQVEEPLPLYFLTRTLEGQKTYTCQALPLQVVP